MNKKTDIYSKDKVLNNFIDQHIFLHNPVLEDKHTLFRAREVDLRDKLSPFSQICDIISLAFPHKSPCNFTRTQNITSYLGFKGQIVS